MALAYDGAVNDGDYSDIEAWILRSGAGPSVDLMRSDFPRWRRLLLENGVERVSLYNAKSSNLMTLLVMGTAPKSHQDQRAMHNIRNILSRQGAPTFHKRGWKS